MWRVDKHTGKENDHEDTKRHRAQQQIKLESLSESLDRAYSALDKVGPLLHHC